MAGDLSGSKHSVGVNATSGAAMSSPDPSLQYEHPRRPAGVMPGSRGLSRDSDWRRLEVDAQTARQPNGGSR
jgi:hypothetical protein